MKTSKFTLWLFQFPVFLRSVEKNGIQSKFTHFILSAVNEKSERDIELETSVVGSLQLYGDAAVRFSDSCQNAIIEADPQPKTEIQVRIISCVYVEIDKLENVITRHQVIPGSYIAFQINRICNLYMWEILLRKASVEREKKRRCVWWILRKMLFISAILAKECIYFPIFHHKIHAEKMSWCSI